MLLKIKIKVTNGKLDVGKIVEDSFEIFSYNLKKKDEEMKI